MSYNVSYGYGNDSPVIGSSPPKFYEPGATEYAKYLANQMITPQKQNDFGGIHYGLSFGITGGFCPPTPCVGCGPTASSVPFRGRGYGSPW